MSQGIGTVIVKVNGKALDAKLGTKYKLGGMSREPLVSNGVAGKHFFEKPMPSEVSVTITVTDSTDLDEIRDWKNVVLVIKPDAGSPYQVTGAFCSNGGELEVSDQGGDVQVMFQGPPATAL